ncbi:MAG: FHA domain-containing protein [Deltaproteobacteria bacterium]|jgi:hypothetical protein
MRSQSIATRSIRRARREVRPPSRITGADEAGIQIFVFRADRFLGSLMFDGAEPIVVGRHQGAGVRLDGEKISRRHCQLVLVDSQVFVEDLGSGNGTFINRERVYKREPVRATDGLCIGVYTLKVRTLRAAPLAPMDDAAADRTTKVDAILEADRTGGTDEVVVDLVSDELDNALYAEALRRQTGEERPKGAKVETRSCRPSSPLDDSHTEATANDDSVQVKPQVLPERTRRPRTQAVELPKHPATKAEAPKRASTRAEAPKRARTHSGLPKGAGAMAKLSVEPHNIRPKSPLDQDSTMLAAKEVSLRPDSDSAGLDPEVEARLKDLDDLIASLDARYGNERQASSVPWRQDGYQSKATPAPSAAIPRSSIVEDSSLPGQPKMSTREFARDLASRLALDGAVIVTPTPKIIEEDPTEAADANDPLAIEAARLAAQNADDDQPRTAKADEQELAAITAAKALDDGPETELMDREIPILMEPRLPSIVARTRAPIVDRERPPIHTNPPTPAPSPAEPPKKMVHEARLLTPTPGEHQALNPDGSMAGESSFYDDVWTNSSDREDLVKSKPYPKVLVEGAAPNAERGPRISKHAPSSPPPLPKTSRPARRASPVVRPKSRIDDFDPSQPAPRTAFDGVEISARTKSRLVDIAVLRKGNEQYILGHRTPQGAVAPGRAHLGLRLLRINPDRTVDLVFPQDAGGHLMRGKVTVMFNELSEGRRYSCLRLEPTDIATVILGEGKNAITYHIRFLRRPKSLFSSLRRSHTEAARST